MRIHVDKAFANKNSSCTEENRVKKCWVNNGRKGSA
jgi:hypothetical protein